MALPTTMSIGSRVIWWAGYQPPIPPPALSGPTLVPGNAGYPGVTPTPPNVAGTGPMGYPGMTGTGPFVGLCQSVGGSSPDFVGSTAAVHDSRGQPFLVQLGINFSTWQSGGSQPALAHWQFVDLSA
jgi:hypothetical protein